MKTREELFSELMEEELEYWKDVFARMDKREAEKEEEAKFIKGLEAERIEKRTIIEWQEPSWKKNKVKCTVEFLEDQGRSDRDKQLHNL